MQLTDPRAVFFFLWNILLQQRLAVKLLDQECYKCTEDTNIPCWSPAMKVQTYANCSGLLQTRTIFVSKWFWYTSMHPCPPSGSFMTGGKLAMASQGMCSTMRYLDFRAFVLGLGDVYKAAKTSFLLRLQDSHLASLDPPSAGTRKLGLAGLIHRQPAL